MGSSFSLIFHSSFEKRIIETNNETTIAIINFKFLFYGGTLDLADDCKKSHDKNSARQWSEAGRSRRSFD